MAALYVIIDSILWANKERIRSAAKCRELIDFTKGDLGSVACKIIRHIENVCPY